MITHKFKEVKQIWKKRGFSCGLWEDLPEQEWNNFIHNEDEIILLVEGEIEISIGENKIRPKIGEEVLIPARSAHSLKNTGSLSNCWYYGYRLAQKKD